MTQQVSTQSDTAETQGEGFSLEMVQRLEQHGAQSPSLGSIISWGIKNVILSEAELRQHLDSHDLQDVKIPQIRKRKALNRALKEMVEDELIRLVADNAQKITYVVVKLSNDADLEDVLFNKTLKLTYRKDAAPGIDPLTFSSTAAEHTLRPLIEKYQSCYVSSDISRFILLVTIKQHGGIPLRPEGGMYFVPSKHHDTVFALRRLMEALGKTQNALAYLSMFNVIDDGDAKADMQRHAHDALKGELRDLGHLLAKLQGNPERTVRATTIEKYLEEAERIAQEASLYRDLIMLEAEDITAALDNLRQQFRAVVQGEATFGDDPFADNQTSPSPAQPAQHGSPEAREQGASQTAIPPKEIALPDDLIPLRAFADLHAASRNEAERLWKTGFIRAKKGNWVDGKQRITLALDAQGCRDFWVQFHEIPGFRSCDSCPHALTQREDVPF